MNVLIRAVVRLVPALVLIFATSGCADESPRIGNPDHGWGGAAIPHREANVPYPLVGAISLCLDRPGSIEITNVTMEHTEGGFRVDTFATKRAGSTGKSYDDPQTFNESLSELGFVPGYGIVDTVCPDAAAPSSDPVEVTHFALQFNKSADATARGAIIRIEYNSSGETYTHRMGFEMVLCQHGEDSPDCNFLEYKWPDGKK